MSQPAGKPKPAFFVAVLVVIAALVGLAVVRCTKKKGSDSAAQKKDIDLNKIKETQNLPKEAEAVDPDGITTVKEYTFQPADKLPEVKGSAAYDKMSNRTVRFSINVWAGWAPIIHANEGFKAKKEWKDAKGQPFKVELVVIDDPVSMRDALAAGKLHIGWGTVDMIPLFVEGLKKDPRTMPRIFQQIDWSNGGDGIVVRDSIKTAADLKGKTIVLAQNSPSHYFLLNVLLNSGIQPRDVNLKFTTTAFEAAAAFVSTPSIGAVVSWAPDIYSIPDKVKGTKILVTTKTANKLIADVWFARADFARDNPDIIEGLVTGILDGVEELSSSDDNKTKVGDMLDKFYGLKEGTGKDMLGDAHWTNYAENKDFFLVSNNPTNFQRTYESAVKAYARAGVVKQDVEFEKIMDFSVVKKLEKVDRFAKQKNTYDFKFEPTTASKVEIEKSVTTSVITVNFYPNSNDIFHKVPAANGSGEVYYDGKILYTIDQIAKIAGQYGTARIVIEGHTDASMKGQVDASLVKDLAQKRAEAVKKGVLEKYPKLDKNQMVASGIGWDRPLLEEKEPDPVKLDQIRAKNRRVEIKVIPAEK